jgi:hypothetical protein
MGKNLNTALHEALDQMGAPRDEGEVSASAEELALEEAEDEGTPGTEEEEPEEQADDDLEASEEESDDEGEASGSAADEGEERTTYKVADLARAIGWEPSDLYTDLQVPLGDGSVVTLEQLKSERDDFLAKQSEIEKSRAEIAQQAQQVMQARQQLSQQSTSEAYLEAVGAVKAIEAQYANVDWEQMDQQDPGRAANLRQRFATSYAAAKHAAEQVRTEEEQKRYQEQYQWFQQAMVQEDQKLKAMVPEWQSMETVQQEVPQINEYLYSMGYTPEELQTVVDARARAIARDAWKWRQHQAQIGEVKKAVKRKAPKPVLRPGRGRTVKQASERRVQALEQRALATQNQRDKLAAAREIFNQSRTQKRRA